jgi:hypothetical protein
MICLADTRPKIVRTFEQLALKLNNESVAVKHGNKISHWT